jgi:hypothetical protein
MWYTDYWGVPFVEQLNRWQPRIAIKALQPISTVEVACVNVKIVLKAGCDIISCSHIAEGNRSMAKDIYHGLNKLSPLHLVFLGAAC